VIEPIFSLEVAAELIPIDMLSLQWLLDTHAHEFSTPTYHTMAGVPYNVRMLTESDCLKARELVFVQALNSLPDGHFRRRNKLFRGRGLPRQHGMSTLNMLRIQVA